MGAKFTKFPMIWRDTLAEIGADAATYRVALYLLDRAAWVQKVPLGNRVLERHGVNRWAKWRALKRLREVGLIAVESRRGRAPLVTVRFTR